MKWSHTFWTETGKTMGSTSDNKAIMDDFKSGAFNTRNNNKEIMIVGHQDGKTLGYAVWNVASAYQGNLTTATHHRRFRLHSLVLHALLLLVGDTLWPCVRLRHGTALRHCWPDPFAGWVVGCGHCVVQARP